MYIRNHNLVPTYDEDFEIEFRLTLSAKAFAGRQLKEYSLADLKNLKPHEVTTSMACAGNRRRNTRKIFPSVKGVNWGVGAIGNNIFKGVTIRDLLLDSGFTEQELNSGMFKGKHLVATGLDTDFQGVPFSISFEIERALDPLNEVILAYQMNGKDIPYDHGYPLRLVAPGYIGVRNCKWVTKLEISDEEADSHMQRRDYKYIKEEDWSKINLKDYPAINGNIPIAAIAFPDDNSTVKLARDEKLTLKGYATGDGSTGTYPKQV